MANDMPNATASFAIAMRGHEDQSIVDSHAAEAEEATRPGKVDLKGETAQLSGGSMLAGGPTEHLEECDTKSSYPQSGTRDTLLPTFSAVSSLILSSLVSRYPLFSSFGPMVWCDGPCKTTTSAYISLHSCKICENMELCWPCLEFFRKGGFVNRMCKVRHEYFKIFPLPKGSEDLAVKIVRGHVVPREEWLRGVREKYGGGD